MRIDPDIRALDLEAIAFKACVDEGWNIDDVDAAEKDYRIFLQAVRDNPGMSLAPTRRTDKFWHHHILDTTKYISDCDRLFGRYIHHFPYSGVLNEADAKEQDGRFMKTQDLLRSYA